MQFVQDVAGGNTLHMDSGSWQCEVITLCSRSNARGIVRTLLSAAQDFALASHCQRIYLTTTNDNTNAIRFYQRSGWQFSALHKGIVDRVCAMKPDLALLGFDNIQIRDEIEFERWLCAANGSPA